MSIFGRSSNRTPGARTRFGPVKVKGEARSDQIGSVNMLRPWVCTSTVAWPTHVATICGPSIWRAGTVGDTGICSGQTARSRPSMKETSRPGLGRLLPPVPNWPSELKKRSPSKRSEEHTSELQSLMRISYAVFCLKKTNNKLDHTTYITLHIYKPRTPSLHIHL